MNKKLIALAVAGAIASPLAAQAGTLTTANMDITLSGGATGGYSYNSDTGRDKFIVDDALIDLSSEAMTGGMGVTLGIGTLTGNSLAGASNLGVIGASSGTSSTSTTSVQYGYVTVKPTNELTVDAGKIATNVGYEVVPSYANGNILRGMVWNAQPTYYTGARGTYSMGGMSFYVEANKDAVVSSSITNSTNAAGGAIGASGSFGGVDASFSYFSDTNEKNIYDFIFSTNVGGIDLAANIDFQQLAKAQKKVAYNPNWVIGQDDNAYGVALYATVPLSGNWSLPIRFEYVDDGTSGIYGFQYKNPTTSKLEANKATSLSVTPTYNFSSSTFVRAELAYVSTDKKSTFVDDKGVLTDSNIVVGAQGGVLF